MREERMTQGRREIAGDDAKLRGTQIHVRAYARKKRHWRSIGASAETSHYMDNREAQISLNQVTGGPKEQWASPRASPKPPTTDRVEN